MDEVYCGAPVDGGLCLHLVSKHGYGLGGGFCYECKSEHRAVPAYVRCPECDGTKVKLHGHKEDGDWYADVCGCSYSRTPGFIPVSEEVQT